MISKEDYKYCLILKKEFLYTNYRDSLPDFKPLSFAERLNLGMNANDYYYYEKNELARRQGVYFLMKGDNIIYIGASINIEARWKSHRNKMGHDYCMMFITEQNPFELEKRLIEKHKPIKNKIGV